MKIDRGIQGRRSVRLKAYDYSEEGAYFLTICAYDRECIFGEIAGGSMQLNEYGMIVTEAWHKMPEHFSCIELDEFVVMPNHMHGIIMIVGRGMACHALTTGPNRQFGKPIAGSLSTIIGSFKSAVTKQINTLRNTPGRPVWQRNYYEHIIRNENDLDRIRQYIVDNPMQWEMDENHPMNNNGMGMACHAPTTANTGI